MIVVRCFTSKYPQMVAKKLLTSCGCYELTRSLVWRMVWSSGARRLSLATWRLSWWLVPFYLTWNNYQLSRFVLVSICGSWKRSQNIYSYKFLWFAWWQWLEWSIILLTVPCPGAAYTSSDSCIYIVFHARSNSIFFWACCTFVFGRVVRLSVAGEKGITRGRKAFLVPQFR